MSQDFDQDELDALLGNSSFREWVLVPTRELEEEWRGYLNENPEKEELLQTARRLLLVVEGLIEKDYPEPAVVSQLFDRIQTQKKHPRFRRRFQWYYGAAAVLFAVCGYYGWCYATCDRSKVPDEVSYQSLVTAAPCALQEYKNETSTAIQILLADSSEVRLEPGSKISYAVDLGKHATREVYLEGTAFFQVTHNPDVPFVVYANELVTRVLGTSFWVSKSADQRELSVEVVSGKVVVWRQTPKKNVATQRDAEIYDQVLVTPNQQLLYSRNTVSMRRHLVPNPQIVNVPELDEALQFDDAPVEEVFKAVEKAYAVQIEFDKNKLGSCLVTASLSGEHLYETISAVCEDINARYQVVDTKIVINGYGCT